MNAAEIGLLIKYVRGQWPHYEINDGTPVAYERLLGDLDASEVLATIDEYAVKGEKFAPSPGELRRMTITRLLPPVPDAGQAWGHFLGLLTGRGAPVPESALPLLNEIAERFGGWAHIRATWLVENEMADRAHFFRMWNAMVESEVGHATALPGPSRQELDPADDAGDWTPT